MQAFYVDTVDSTNEEAKRLLRAGRIDRVGYVHAREQTAGKGNYSRTWLSPRDRGIYMSVIECAPSESLSIDTLFTPAAGVACATVLREVTGLDVRLKPINDLYVGDRKLGGVLVESLIEAGRIRAVITGIGINTHAADLPVPRGSAPPVSLQDLMEPAEFEGLAWHTLITSLARAVLEWNDRCWHGRSELIRTAWTKLSVAGTVLPQGPAQHARQ